MPYPRKARRHDFIIFTSLRKLRSGYDSLYIIHAKRRCLTVIYYPRAGAPKKQCPAACAVQGI